MKKALPGSPRPATLCGASPNSTVLSRLLPTFALVACITTFARSQGTWTTLSSEGFTPRSSYSAAAAPDLGAAGSIYTFGGSIFTGTEYVFFNVIEVFDISTGKWTSTTPTDSLEKRGSASASYVNGKFYIIGPYNLAGEPMTLIEEYDPVTNHARRVIPSGTVPRLFSSGATTVGGKIYFFGGRSSLPGPQVGDNLDVNIFDPIANTWETRPLSGDPFVVRNTPSVAAIGDDIYITGGGGGTSGTETFSTNERYSITTGALATVESLPTELRSHSAVSYGGKVYFIGGQTDAGGTLNTNTFIFDPEGESDKYQYLSATGDHVDNPFGPSVSVGNIIYQIGYGTSFSTVPPQSLTLEPASVAKAIDATSLQVAYSDGRLTLVDSDMIEHVEIFSIIGKTVAQADVASRSAVIEIGSLTTGCYFVKALTAGGSKVAKLLIP